MTPEEQLKQLTDALQKVADSKAKANQEEARNGFFNHMGKMFADALKPLQKAFDEMRGVKDSIDALSSRLDQEETLTPEIKVDLSQIKVPTPNVMVKPIVDLGQIKMPKEMDIKGWVNFQGYDRSLLTNPLPVQLRDADGNPVKLFEGLTQIIGGGGGGWSGGGNHVIVDSMPSISVTSTGNSSISLVNSDGVYYNSDNPLPISGSFTASSLQVSGAIDSVNLQQIGGNQVVVGTGYQDNALRVVLATDAIASVSIASNIAALDVIQVSGSISSVNLTQTLGSATVVGTGYQDNALRVVHATDAVASVSIVSNTAALDVVQVSGSISSVNLMQTAGNSTVVGTGYQDNALRVVNATDAITSVNLTQTLGSATVVGTGYQDNALRVVHATDAIASVSIVSNIAALDVKQVSGSIDSVSVIGVSMTTNPTAVGDATNVTIKTDKLGRQLARPIQVRGLIATAYASITNGTEATLLTATAATYLDLIYVMGTNNSDAAVTVDLRAVSAGNIQTSIRIPANGTAGVSLPVPIPQDETGNAWTVDMPDITGTTVTISALFSKEV